MATDKASGAFSVTHAANGGTETSVDNPPLVLRTTSKEFDKTEIISGVHSPGEDNTDTVDWCVVIISQ